MLQSCESHRSLYMASVLEMLLSSRSTIHCLAHQDNSTISRRSLPGCSGAPFQHHVFLHEDEAIPIMSHTGPCSVSPSPQE